MGGATFSDSDSAPVPKLLKQDPGPKLFQIRESDSCSDSGYHRPNGNLPVFLLEKWPRRLLLLPNLKSYSVSERKKQNPAGVDSGSMVKSGGGYGEVGQYDLIINRSWNCPLACGRTCFQTPNRTRSLYVEISDFALRFCYFKQPLCAIRKTCMHLLKKLDNHSDTVQLVILKNWIKYHWENFFSGFSFSGFWWEFGFHMHQQELEIRNLSNLPV